MIRRTTWTDVALPFAVALVVVYLVLRVGYESLPPFQWFTAVPLGALAALEVLIAVRVRAAVRHRPDAKPMTALGIARAVALGKASILVGAVVAGAAVALVITVLPDAGRADTPAHDLRVGIAVAVVSVLLTAAGVLLERAGIDPGHGR